MSPFFRQKIRYGGLFITVFLSLFVKAETQVQFWTMQLSPFHDDYVNELIQRFEKQNPGVTVKWIDVPWKEMEKKMLAAVASNTAPDVVNLNPQFSAKLAEYEALADPEDFLSDEQIRSYVPNAWQANRFREKTFALPWYLSTTITIYNSELLNAAGVEAPVNHPELLAVARQIKSKLGKYAYFPAMDGSRALEDMVTMGGRLINPQGDAAGFDDKDGQAFFRFYQELFQQDLIPGNVLTEGHHKAVELFQSGELAIITTGMQFLNTIEINAPQLFRHVGIAPQLISQRKPAKFNIAMMNLAVPVASVNKEMAFKFAGFVTSHENQLAFAKRVPILPSTLISYQDAFFNKEQADASLIEKARKLSAEQVLKGDVLVPALPKYSKLRSSFIRNLQAAMVEQKSVEQAVKDTVDTWNLFLRNTNE